MMKTLKGKVLTGATAITLIAGGTAVFASTDAGSNFKSWYNGLFNQSTASIAKDSKDHINGQVGQLTNEYNGLKTDATEDINFTRDNESANAQSEINKAKNEQIASLTIKENQIKGYMDEQFDGIFAYANNVINNVGTQASTYAEGELTSLTNKNGSAAVAQVNKEITATSNQATTDLQTAINQAKSEVSAQLKTETDATTKEIKAAIDAKIVELRATITKKKEELVAKQQRLITAEADKLEAQAKADLDAVVSNINN